MNKVFFVLTLILGVSTAACSSTTAKQSEGRSFESVGINAAEGSLMLKAERGETVSIQQQAYQLKRRYHSANGDLCVVLVGDKIRILCSSDSTSWFQVRNVLGEGL